MRIPLRYIVANLSATLAVFAVSLALASVYFVVNATLLRIPALLMDMRMQQNQYSHEVDWVQRITSPFKDSIHLSRIVFDMYYRNFDRGFYFFRNILDVFFLSITIAAGLSLSISAAFQLYSLRTLRNTLLNARKGIFEFNLLTSCDVSYAASYIGTQTFSMAFGWFINLFVIFTVFFCGMWDPAKQIIVSYLAWPTAGLIALGIVIRCIDVLLIKYNPLDRRSLSLLELFLGLANVPLAVGSSFFRLMLSFLQVGLSASKVDYSTKITGPKSDMAHSSYRAMLLLDHLHSSPLISSIVTSLQKQIANYKQRKLDLSNDLIKPSLRVIAQKQVKAERAEKRYLVFFSPPPQVFHFQFRVHRLCGPSSPTPSPTKATASPLAETATQTMSGPIPLPSEISWYPDLCLHSLIHFPQRRLHQKRSDGVLPTADGLAKAAVGDSVNWKTGPPLQISFRPEM